MNFDEEQAQILNEVDSLLAHCEGKGPSWGRYKGDVVCRVVAEHIQRHLPRDYKVGGPSIYIEGFPWEFDLMIVSTEAKTIQYTNAYQANQVYYVIEIKKHGIYGKREELEQIVKTRIKNVFDVVFKDHSQIKPVYLAIQETINPTKPGAIRYADITRKSLDPYPVYVLQDTRGKLLQKGEWQRFIEYITSGLY